MIDRLALSLLALALLMQPAQAQPGDPDLPEDDEEPASFSFDWEDSTDDADREEFERLMDLGRREVFASADAINSRSGADAAMRAANHFARAAKLRPKDPKPHYYAAFVLERWDDITYSFPKRIKEVIYHLTEFIRLAPYDSRLPDALFSRSIAYTKLGGDDNIRLALKDYDERLRLLNQLSLEAQERYQLALILSNSAELYMYVGELDRAIGLYYDSLEYAAGQSAILYKYGLAVALDRDGQRLRAAAIMKDATQHDPHGPLGQLTRGDVFFIPEGDIHYYRGLAFEASGSKRKALTYYRRFLTVLPDSQYAERARENIKALEATK